jgi:hypothetical protein
MSLKLKHEVRALERRVAELEKGTNLFIASVSEGLTKRVEAIEQRKKPGPKPKNNRDNGMSPKIPGDAVYGPIEPFSSAKQ